MQDLKPVIGSGMIKAYAHITGGGLLENIPRVLPNALGVEVDALKWNIPGVFGWLATVGKLRTFKSIIHTPHSVVISGGVNEYEMLRTFNCGVGAILIVSPQHNAAILESLASSGATRIGHVVEKTSCK